MKKLLGIMAITALAASAFAQGTITVANGTAKAQQWTSTANSTIISMPKSGGQVEVFAAPIGAAAPTALFTATTGGYTENYSSLAGWLADNTSWAAAGAIVPIGSAVAGNFSGGTQTISNIARGANAQYFLFGWTGAATSLDSAIQGGAMAGMSAVWVTATGDPLLTPVAGTPVSIKTTFNGLVAAPIVVSTPEPTSFALAGLGLAALLAIRRRK